ncbi:hypothetical protein F5B19DRAFT_469809 [Rostrohypoxylon terebratum]|nr:hypothetical protein F5B19DRAFT_469809 [Rostrohypoxylon terebratum]
MLALTPPGHTNRAAMLSFHASIHSEIFKQTGSRYNLEMLVQSREDAVKDSDLYGQVTQAMYL